MGRVVVEGVCKAFDLDGRSVQAVDNINFTLEEGQFGALIGPSGCGKSTILRMVADVLGPTSGTITIDGAPPEKVRRDHGVGFVFQDPSLLPWRTALENVRLPLEVVSARGQRSQATPQDLLDLVGLSGFEHARPSQLSGGMQQRCAIARALVLKPKVLLLDEPFGALDEITRHRLNLELLRVWSQTRTTALLVTHSIQEAVFMADRIFVLAARPGRLTDTVEVDLERPRRMAQMSDPAFVEAVAKVRASLFGDQAGAVDYG